MNHIIITSIFQPTEAVQKFSEMKNFKLIVVGDNKSPDNWHQDNVTYLSVENQKKLNFKLSETLPFNHYCRKMIGYLYAINDGAKVIIDTDDDNIPKENWKFPDNFGQFDCIDENKGFINIYNYYTDDHIWPRGLPLRLINNREELKNSENCKKDNIKVGIWQGLADEDPDVDAIYRLTSDKVCNFNYRDPIVLKKGTITPFNSQNTSIIKDLFPLLYLPSYVTFRFTDILRGLIAQPIMWKKGYHLGFTNATVVQIRNPHDYVKDFISEIPMYLHTDKVIELVSKVVKDSDSIETNLYNAYDSLLKEGIVVKQEIETLECWLDDLNNINRR